MSLFKIVADNSWKNISQTVLWNKTKWKNVDIWGSGEEDVIYIRIYVCINKY